MSSCLSSRAAACGFNLEHMIKWPLCSRTTTTNSNSNSSSPSSTLSESTNSPIVISTRKPRKQRKRPNQTYNEAAALLSMACPNIFTTKHLTRSTSLPKFTKQNHSLFSETPELIENLGLEHRIMEKPFLLIQAKVGEIESKCGYVEISDGCLDDFDTESILDEEIEQGIDSIMGDSNSIQENIGYDMNKTCYGYPIGLGFGVRNGVRALRNDNERNWWCSPMVDVVNISKTSVADCEKEKAQVGKVNKNTKKKKKVEELMKSESESEFEHLSVGNGHGLMLKLDYVGVMNAWTDKGLLLPEEISTSTSPGGDIHAKAANIDLFSKNSESSVTRSMDKNHFKKIRTHQIKNTLSDRRPRCKGRFVKKTSSSVCYEET